MKNFFLVILFLIISSTTHASICSEYLADLQLYDLTEETESSRGVVVPGEQMQWSYPSYEFDVRFKQELGEFSQTECASAIRRNQFKVLANAEIMYAIVTNEDVCDGGNSYGFIVSEEGHYIATIADSYISCI